MSVLAHTERNQLTEEPVLQYSETDTRSLKEGNSVQDMHEDERYEGVEDTEQWQEELKKSSAQCVSSVAHIDSVNSETLNSFHGRLNMLNSSDEQLTSQILSSIQMKIASSISRFNEEPPDLLKESNHEFVAVKQEIPDEFVEFHPSNDDIYSNPQTSHPSSDSIYSFPQTSQPAYQRHSMNYCSASSLDSLNQSPDSSVLSIHPSTSFPNTSSSIVGLSINQLSVPQSELNQAALSRSELPVSLCYSSMAPLSSCDSNQAVSAAVSKPASKQGNLLPPCRVCGEKASGFHYGANTCEACKGFFRRSLKKDRLDFKCNGDNSCRMQKGKRNNCALCRYNRCLNAGMSKQAIKTGRYTHEKRTQDIVEVKTLNGELDPHVSQLSFIKTEYLPNVPRKGPPRKTTLSDENKELLNCIFSAHKMLFPFWHKVLDTGSNKIVSQRYAEKYELCKRLNVDTLTSCMMPEEYDNYSNTKGVEQNGQRDTMAELTQHIELAIVTFVRFAKAVPGFTELCLNDQATLVKLSRFEIWMIGAHKFMDLNLKVVSGPRGKAYHMEELYEILDEGFVNALFSFAHSMQEIQMTNEETALLKCVALMFSDRSELQDPDKVADIQQRLTECLEELLGNGQRFAKVMNALVRLRNLTEWNKTISENMVLEWPNMKQHPLLLEIMSV